MINLVAYDLSGLTNPQLSSLIQELHLNTFPVNEVNVYYLE